MSIISVMHEQTNYSFLFKMCKAVSLYSEAVNGKELKYSPNLDLKAKQMSNLGLRGTITPTGVLLSPKGEMDPWAMLETIRTNATETARGFIGENNVVANDAQIRICTAILRGHRMGWLNVKNILVESGVNFTVEVELP